MRPDAPKPQASPSWLDWLLRALGALAGRRLLSPFEQDTLQQQVLKLQAQNQSLDELASRLRHSQADWQQQQLHTHQQQVGQLQQQLQARDSTITTLQTRLAQLQLNIDQTLGRQFQENQALLNQLNWLSGTIAHDFRAPLRAIDANSFFLEDDLGDAGPADAKKSLSEIRRNGKRMGVLIDGLLDYLRVGVAPLQRQPLDLHEVISQVVAQDFPGAPISLADDLHIQLEGDRGFLMRLFKELLDNAVKFSAPVESPHIQVRRAGQQAVEVIDNGVGFSESYRDQLFQLFHRLHGNDEFVGEGIGLCVAQRIAQRHGGDVQLHRTANHTIAFVQLGNAQTALGFDPAQASANNA